MTKTLEGAGGRLNDDVARLCSATFGIQCVNVEGQRRVLKMKLSSGGHDLDLTDDVDDGVAAQHLSCDCE